MGDRASSSLVTRTKNLTIDDIICIFDGLLSIYFWFICTAKNVVNTYIVKLRKPH